MEAAARPFTWNFHLATWAVVVAGVVSVVVGHRRLAAKAVAPIPWSRRQILQFSGAVITVVVALTWPLADLAAHWSLTTLVIQRLILLLVVSPLLLLGLPYDVVQWATRPAAVDALLIRLQKPPVAIVVVTVVAVGSMTPAIVRAQSESVWARGLIAMGVVVAGLVLWIPVLGRIPGILRLKPIVRFGYLVAQAVVPAFLSFIYIFSTHPLYNEFSRSKSAIGLQPLNDQQIAGFVSKLTMLFTLLIVGAVVLARAPRNEEELVGGDPLVWADVEREFERFDRRGPRGAPPEPPVGSDGRSAAPPGRTGPSGRTEPSGHTETPEVRPGDQVTGGEAPDEE